MSIFTKLFPSYNLPSFSFMLFLPFPSSLFPLILYSTLYPICSPSLVRPQSVQLEIVFNDGKERPSNKAFIQDRELQRVVNGGWGRVWGQRVLTALQLLTQEWLGFSRLDSCIKPHDFKAFMGWQGPANFKVSNQLESQRTQDNHQWAKWNCWSEAALLRFQACGPATQGAAGTLLQ